MYQSGCSKVLGADWILNTSGGRGKMFADRSNVNCLHVLFLATRISSFEKAVFSSFSHFFIGLLIFWEFSFLSSLYIMVFSPLFDI
jgi:hypothetical protein